MSFERVCQEPACRAAMSSATARTVLKKRLQRGRKFELPVRILGPSMLRAVKKIQSREWDQMKTTLVGVAINSRKSREANA